MLARFVQLTRRKDQAKDQENTRNREDKLKGEDPQDKSNPTFFSHLPTLAHGSPKRQLFNHDIGYRIDETQIEIDQKHLNYEEADGPSGRLAKLPCDKVWNIETVRQSGTNEETRYRQSQNHIKEKMQQIPTAKIL